MPVTPRVLLVGLMGAGKSAVGRRLADALGVTYVDNDTGVASREGGTTPQIAHDRGADELHRAEREWVRSVLARPAAAVVGIPASAADDPGTVELVGRSGFVVYLRATPETLAARVRRGGPRPFVDGDPLPLLTDMTRRRDGTLRSMADLVVDTDDQGVDRTVEQVLAAVHPATAAPPSD